MDALTKIELPRIDIIVTATEATLTWLNRDPFVSAEALLEMDDLEWAADELKKQLINSKQLQGATVVAFAGVIQSDCLRQWIVGRTTIVQRDRTAPNIKPLAFAPYIYGNQTTQCRQLAGSQDVAALRSIFAQLALIGFALRDGDDIRRPIHLDSKQNGLETDIIKRSTLALA